MSDTHQEEKKSGWRWGVNRWILLAFIIAGSIWTGKYLPARPAIFLEAEPILGTKLEPLFIMPVVDAPIYLTNTLIATLLADLVLLLVFVFAMRPAIRKGYTHVAGGLAGAVEALLGALYGLTEDTAGKKWARVIFPWFATITMLVLVMNWMELFPGVDAIGVFHDPNATAHVVEVDEDHGEEVEAVVAGGLGEELTFDDMCDSKEYDVAGLSVISFWVNPDHKDEGTAECAHYVIPFVRAVATDLNFTVALALVSVVMIQVIGVKALGWRYFEKFINVRTLFTGFSGVIDFAVGLFEIVSELSKVISFSFRLFGNIFAGAVLLFVMGTLIPVGAQAAVLALEWGVGLIQAVVFGMLTMIFMAQATHSHFDDGEEHH